MESEKNYIRMYPVSGVEEVELLFEKESGLFVVKHENASTAFADPRDAWIKYSTLITNIVLKRITNKHKRKEFEDGRD